MGATDLTLGYYDNDAPRSVTSGTTTTTFTLDAAGRRLVQATTGQGPFPAGTIPKTQVTRHYGDDSDNPAWTSYDNGTTTRFLSGIGGDLGINTTATKGGATGAELTVANPHGDVVTTITLPETGPVTGITAWSDHTEYGTPRAPAAAARVGGPMGYGWLGTKERATPGETFGLTLMGARYYNPVTGRFTSTDPVHGGNPNTYTYPLDPINAEDLDGQWRRPKWLTWRNAGRVAGAAAFGACVFASAGVCLGAGLVAAGLQSRGAGHRFFTRKWWGGTARGAAWAGVGAGVGKAIGYGYQAARRGGHALHGPVTRRQLWGNRIQHGWRGSHVRRAGYHPTYYKYQAQSGVLLSAPQYRPWRRR